MPISSTETQAPLRNWAGNVTFGARAVHRPTSVAELPEIVRKAERVKALGSGHCFNAIADTDGDLVVMRGLDRVIDIDRAANTVTVEGGITYGTLGPILEASGFTLGNFASLPHISVAGAIVTATHGSGNANQNLASAVAALTLVTASGDLLHLKRGDADFDGAVVNLGALGLISDITLDLKPSFAVRQRVYDDLPFTVLAANFEAISSAAYSVSGFTNWHGDSVQQVWLKSLQSAAPPPADLFSARAATRAWHPIATLDPAGVTEQMDVPGPAWERLPHFRMAGIGGTGDELQTEYFVPRKDAAAAILAVHAVRHHFSPLVMAGEIRTIAADALWLSHNYQQDSIAFHFTWQNNWPAVRAALPAIEAALSPFHPRPHWGKLFTLPRDTVQASYPRFADFRALAKQLDPKGKFSNRFVDEHVLR
ncbi:MAG: FAD-binding protein [Devosia sp.]